MVFGLSLMCVLSQSACMVKNIPLENVVMFDKRGRLVDPTENMLGLKISGFRYSPIDDPSLYFEKVTTAMKNHPRPSNGRRKVLFYIHGGLNTQKSTLERARDLTPRILEAGYFPIFVNWQSSLPSSYLSHLLWVRQGRDWDWWLSPLAPFYLGADIARGVVRSPMVSLAQIYNDILSFPFLKPYHKEICTAKALEKEYREAGGSGNTSNPALAISYGPDQRTKGEMAVSFGTYVLTLPFKWVLTPIALDTFGTNSWEMMNRNARMLFYTEDEFFSGSPRTDQSGGFYRFMKALKDIVDENPEEWEITLVGHSMGTIVMNEIIRSFSLNFENIVYMAGAASVRDYQDTIFPYLKTHPQTQVYHLVLHPLAEIRDRWGDKYFWIDPPMRGSLLVWIDQFLSRPETSLDKTVGRYSNLMRAIHTTPGLTGNAQSSDDFRSQIHIKVFGVGEKMKDLAPQRHGAFNDFDFWEEGFWKPGQTSNDLSDYQCLSVQ